MSYSCRSRRLIRAALLGVARRPVPVERHPAKGKPKAGLTSGISRSFTVLYHRGVRTADVLEHLEVFPDCDKEPLRCRSSVPPEYAFEISELHRSIRLSYIAMRRPGWVSLISISVPLRETTPNDATYFGEHGFDPRDVSFVSCDMVCWIRIGMPNTSPNVSQ